MREIKKRTVRAAVCAALLSGWAGAAAADEITTTISGYGTLGGSFTSDNQYAYHHDGNEFTGANEQFDVALDSRLGLQAVVDFGSGLSVTAQELVKQRGSDEFSLGTEWLYVQYAPDSHWKLRLGRVALAAFLLSDVRNVGYAQPWFRQPNEVYGAESFQSLNGGQALYHVNLGPVGLGLEGAFGNSTEQYFIDGVTSNVNAKNAYNVAVSLEYSNFLVRFAQTFLDLPSTLPLSPTFAVTYVNHDKFNSVGLQYDDGKAIVLSEWAKRSENNIPVLNAPAAASTQWYVAGGWRFGPLTPLVSYAVQNVGTQAFAPPGSFHSWNGSLRYDVVRNIALKAQVSRAQAGNPEYWVTPNPASHEWVSVFSLGADFVF
jgi:hypothetical protein